MSTLFFGVGIDYRIKFTKGFQRNFYRVRKEVFPVILGKGWVGMERILGGAGEDCPRDRLRAYLGGVAGKHGESCRGQNWNALRTAPVILNLSAKRVGREIELVCKSG